jgi:hypothetical protein
MQNPCLHVLGSILIVARHTSMDSWLVYIQLLTDSSSYIGNMAQSSGLYKEKVDRWQGSQVTAGARNSERGDAVS